MSSAGRVSIPLVAQLIPGGVKPGSVFAVEFDPDSQWLAVAASITARSLTGGGRVLYAATTRPADNVKEDLSSLGIDVLAAVKEGRLVIDDWHTATLTGGRLLSGGGPEPYDYGVRIHSLNVADFSVEQLKVAKGLPNPWKVLESWQPGWLLVAESFSVLTRFNDEKTFLEWLETREHREVRLLKRINLEAFVRGIHTESFYKRVEAACDGVIDIRILEQDGVPKNLLRLRTLKGQQHDNRWHEIEIKANGEAVLVS